MDRRQQKTRKAIFDAFLELLEQKTYAKITVQEIIDRANVGRSTFYAHFETKDSLLDELCSGIFTHVFSDQLHTEKTHDFSGQNYDLTRQITHILYHLQDHSIEVTRLLCGESGELFLNSLKTYLPDLFDAVVQVSSPDLPEAFLRNYLAGSFASTIQWWAENGMQNSPEEIAGWYAGIIEHGILQVEGLTYTQTSALS